jgi:hypothetical protein
MAAIFTLCLETGAECTYPVPEGTTAGLQLLCAQVFGVIFITGTHARTQPRSCARCTARLPQLTVGRTAK